MFGLLWLGFVIDCRKKLLEIEAKVEERSSCYGLGTMEEGSYFDWHL